MKVTIENINGANHTVVWHDDFRPEDVGKTIDHCHKNFRNGTVDIRLNNDLVAFALPALPKHPKPEEVSRYAAEGLEIWGEVKGHKGFMFNQAGALVFSPVPHVSLSYKNKDITVTHAIDSETGEKVEVGIDG